MSPDAAAGTTSDGGPSDGAAPGSMHLFHQLQPLLHPALPAALAAQLPAEIASGKSARSRLSSGSLPSVRCAEAYDDNLFIASSDGKIHRFRLSKQGSSRRAERYEYISSAVVSAAAAPTAKPPGHNRTASSSSIPAGPKPVERLILLPSPAFRLLGVLCASTLTFFHLPSLQPVAPDVLPVVKGLAGVVLDDAELLTQSQSAADGKHPEEGSAESVSLCLIRRKSIVTVLLTSIPLPDPGRPAASSEHDADPPIPIVFFEWQVLKDIPLPGGATMGRRFGSKMVIATTTDYRLVDLDASVSSDAGSASNAVLPLGLPISQTQDSPSASVRPSIVTVPVEPADGTRRGRASRCEFLVTSHSENQTLGVFIRSDSGEPTPKLIEWPHHPRSVVVHAAISIALLRNDVVEVHDLASMQLLQRIEAPDSLDARFLSSGATSFNLPADTERSSPNDLSPASLRRVPLDSTPDVTQSTTAQEQSPAQGSARILVGGRDGVHAFVRVSPLARASEMIALADWDALQDMADALLATEASQKDNTDVSVAHYLQQLIAFHHLGLLRFDRAKEAFLRGQAPVTPLIRLFDIAREDFPPSPVPLAPTGLLAEYQRLSSLEQLISDNLAAHYEPDPRDKAEASLSALRVSLADRATEHFLLPLLESLHNEARADERVFEQRRQCSLARVDMLLVRLYAERPGKRDSLRTLLLDEPATWQRLDHRSAQTALERGSHYAIIGERALRDGRHEDYLALATQLIDGQLKDDSWSGTVADVVEAVQRCAGNPAITTKYGIWVTMREPDAGLRILTRRRAKSSRDAREGNAAPSLEDQQAVLRQLEEAGAASAADAYLEAVALSRKNSHPELIQQLFDHLHAKLSALRAADPAQELSMRQAEQDFRDGRYAESLLGHLALLAPHAPLVAARIKLVLLLQGAQGLASEAILDKLAAEDLKLEKAIVLGKLRRHDSALKTLALELGDANSAEAYCSQDGQIVSAILAERVMALAGDASLKGYVALVSRARTQSKTAKGKEDLLQQLLSIYANATQSPEIKLATAHLLNTQALHLSPVEVLHLIQDDWPIGTLETFLSRFFRRQMHELQQGQIIKSISFAQNLEVQETTWATLWSKGGWIQDVDLPDGGHGSAEAHGHLHSEKGVDEKEPRQASARTDEKLDEHDFNAPRR